jgi:beta-lactamase regulating signal transducer with metallopeptidase domain
MNEWILSSSILILVVIGLRTVLKGKISLRLQYALWALVLLRLLIPVNFGSTDISVANLTVSHTPPAIQSTVIPNTQITDHAPNIVPDEIENQIEDRYESQGIDVEVHADGPVNVKAILRKAAPILWAMGFASAAGLFLTTNGRFKRRILDSRYELDIRKNDLDVYVTGEIDTPCLFGLKNPAIYVTYPVADDPTLLRHTLEHEATHYRHGDHIWAVLRCLCLAIHWYNPLVWWAALLSRQDAELACDEATIARLGEGERAEYGRTLIGMTCRKKANVLIAATTMNSGKSGLKERIMLIAKKPKMAFYTLIAVVVIAAVAVGCTFTGARQNILDAHKDLPEYLIDYSYQQIKDRMSREDVHYIGSAGNCSAVYCGGEGPQLILYHHQIQDNRIIITDQSEGEYAISSGLSINHIMDGDKHIYFGTISDTHWIPETDTPMPLGWTDLVFWDANGNQKVVTVGTYGYICVMDQPMADFWVVVNGGKVPLKMEQYLEQGYPIYEAQWNSEQKEIPETIPVTEPTQMPTEIPDDAPPVNLPELLHEQPDPDKICIGVQPTALSTSCYDLYYIIPENQELLLEYYQAAISRGTELFWDNNGKMAGWYIFYQGREWQVFEDGSLRGDMSIAGSDTTELIALCKDAITKAGMGEPVRPEDISGIISATLYWNGSMTFSDPDLLKGAYTVTDSFVLNRLETLFSNSSYYGSVRCPFTAHLELSLETGETILLAMGTDSCASWMSQGVAYGYGEQTDVGISGNEEFYSFFLTDFIHQKAQENPEALAKYWPYVSWGLYARKYSIDETFALMDMFRAYVVENPSDWMVCVALSNTRGLDGAFAQYYANVIGQIYEADPSAFRFACRQMVPEQQVKEAVNFLAFYWNISPEEARAMLDAAEAP